ncbi:MAG TPA: xanthine dehydrogenase family protein subunit M [Anaerolineales bacterium]|nr:xanthine dehydrogenase family protein subunit M [Anaerolineales bacterium]
MLRLPPFEYLAPRTVAEAVTMLAERGPEAMIVAGGTDLYPNMKRRQFEPKALVGLRSVAELKRVTGDAETGLTVGAGMTLTQVSRHPIIAQSYSALAHAAGVVSTAQLRNMGTIGGNLCVDTRCNYYNQTYHWRKSIGFCMKKDGDICLVAPGGSRCWAVSSSDTAPVMIALGASVKLAGPNGERVIPVDALYHDDGMQYITKAPNEILTEIVLPPADGLRTAYLKLRRRGSFDFPILGVAVALRLADDGTCTHAKIVLGAVGSRPVETQHAASLLIGHKLTPEVIEAAAQAAARLAKPMDNTDSVLSYRKKMAHVFTVRALREAVGSI